MGAAQWGVLQKVALIEGQQDKVPGITVAIQNYQVIEIGVLARV